MPRGRPKKVPVVKFKPPTIPELIKKMNSIKIEGEAPPLKYRNNPNYHWVRIRDKPNMLLQFDPANLKDYPEPPTAQALADYEQYLQDRKTGRLFNRPQTIRTRLSTDPAHYQYKHGPLVIRAYQLSQGAKEHIAKLARDHYYGRKNNAQTERRQADMSKFIRALANPDLIWEDARPQEYKANDPIQISLGRLPRWLYQDELSTPRIAHKFYVTEQVEQALYKVALSHGIINWLKPQQLKVGPTVSYLLEIIGHGYLVPVNLPDNPEPALSYPKRHYKYVF